MMMMRVCCESDMKMKKNVWEDLDVPDDDDGVEDGQWSRGERTKLIQSCEDLRNPARDSRLNFPSKMVSRITCSPMSSSAPSTLAKRLLSPSKDLPPLLQSPNASPELNAELYDFIALALRAFVNPWWSKITRYDKEFLPDITRVLTHFVHALEARALAVDLPPLVFHDVPIIVTSHFRDYRNVAEKISTSYAAGGAASLPLLFHHIQPHMALTPDGGIDREYYRQVVDVILKHCLPAEDYEPEAERYIVREIVLKVLLDDVIPKISQPWFIHKLILEQLGQEETPSHLFKVCFISFFTQRSKFKSSIFAVSHPHPHPLTIHFPFRPCSSSSFPLYSPFPGLALPWHKRINGL